MTRHVIDRLGHLGDGIAPGPVYVQRALPGEVLEGDADGGRIARPRIVEPSPHRVAPPCPHYGACGGCALMHAKDTWVAGWKVDVVRRALQAQGLEAPITGIATSPPGSRRRAVLSGRRTKAGALVGFHGKASGTVTGITDCRILRPEILAALPRFERLVGIAGSRKGEMSLHVTHGPAGLDLLVTGGKPAEGGLWPELSDWMAAADVARLTWDGEVLAEARPPYQTLGGVRVVPPPGGFLQATAEGERALIASVMQALEGAGSVVDLFSGCGTFALPLSRRARVWALEGEDAAIRALDAAWRHAKGGHQVEAEVRDLYSRPVPGAAFRGWDAAVIDPPRAGAEAQSAELAASGVGRIASVSCNPVTFARDAAILIAGGFTLDWVRVVDQFRWSPHVEIISSFTR